MTVYSLKKQKLRTLNALLVSAGIAIAAPVICSCITLDWSAAANVIEQ